MSAVSARKTRSDPWQLIARYAEHELGQVQRILEIGAAKASAPRVPNGVMEALKKQDLTAVLAEIGARPDHSEPQATNAAVPCIPPTAGSKEELASEQVHNGRYESLDRDHSEPPQTHAAVPSVSKEALISELTGRIRTEKYQSINAMADECRERLIALGLMRADSSSQRRRLQELLSREVYGKRIPAADLPPRIATGRRTARRRTHVQD